MKAQFNGKQATISDIAKLANVSSTTVSRYLNERYEYMSKQTRENIRQVIEQTNYIPNNFARSLKSQKSSSIAVVIPLVSQSSTNFLRGICEECRRNGYTTVIYDTNGETDTEIQILSQCVANKAAGILLFPSNNEFSYYETIRNNTGIPIVMVNRYLPLWKYDAVYVDHYNLTIQALKTLWTQGYRRIFMFTDDYAQPSSKFYRCQAFFDFLSEHGIQTPKDNFAVVGSDVAAISSALNTFIEYFKRESCAIFTVSLPLCMSIIHILQKNNIQIGSDVGLATYDSNGYSRLISDKIIQVAQPVYNLGIVATKLLIDRIKGIGPNEPVVSKLEGVIIC